MPIYQVVVAALSVSAFCYIYRVYDRDRTRRLSVLHERVALMLWKAAQIHATPEYEEEVEISG
jgi:hypothetical protein